MARPSVDVATVIDAFEQAIGDEQQGVGSASTIVSIEHFSGTGDRRFSEGLVTFRFSLQKPKLVIVDPIAGPDEIVATHGHVAAVLVTQTPNRYTKSYFLFDQFCRQNLSQIA